jgi:MFS family permease
MKNGLDRNIPLYYFAQALHLPFFWLPILYFYLTQVKGFSVIETTFLMGLQEFALIFLELPTGVIADKISRRFSVMLGYIITSLPFILLPFTTSFGVAIVIFIFKAVGKALGSGADSALLYDTLIDLKRTDEYKQIKTKSVAIMMAVATFAMLVGGWMGEQGYFGLTFYIPFLLQLVAAFAVYQMIEPETSRKAQEIQDSNYLTHTIGAIKIIARSKWLIVLAISFAVLEGTAVNMKWYYPSIFENLGYGLLATGVLMGILYGGKTLISALGTKLILKNSLQNSLVWIGIIAVSWGILPLMNTSVGMIGMIIMILLGLELGTNSTEELIHKSLESKVRATAMSFVNLLSSVGATALLWSWGGVLQVSNVQGAIMLQALVFVTLLVVFLYFVKVRSRLRGLSS